jgi:hypothetical protein
MFDYPAHAICLLYDYRLLVPDVIFNAGIAGAYFIIASALCYIAWTLRDFVLPFRTILALFGTFIMACGLSHLSRIGTTLLGGPFYFLDLMICGITFISSVGSGWLLIRNGRQMLRLTREIIETAE